jgi:hypothetical protein
MPRGKKKMQCPVCAGKWQLGPGVFHASHAYKAPGDWDSPNVPVWSCGVCTHEVPRRIRRTKAHMAVVRGRAARKAEVQS